MEVVPSYMRLAAQLDLPLSSFRFSDRVPNSEVPMWLRALDVATLPYPPPDELPTAQSMSPLKLFEYMAAPVPIVASDLPALRDILRHDDNAMLTPPRDPGALAAALASLLRDRGRAKAIADRARTDVAEYTWEIRAQRAVAAAGFATR